MFGEVRKDYGLPRNGFRVGYTSAYGNLSSSARGTAPSIEENGAYLRKIILSWRDRPDRRSDSLSEASAAQHQFTETVDKIRSQLVMTDEESHVNGPVK